MPDRDRTSVIRARQRHMNRLLSMPNVVGVGDGYKTVGEKRTDQLSVVVMVRDKIPREGLSPDHVIPKRLEEVSTDVIEVGDLRAMNDRSDRVRPAPPGVSLGHYQVTAGTFGAVVRERATGDRLILSNNHVLANSNGAKFGDPILQPGAADDGRRMTDELGTLERFVPLEFSIEPPSCIAALGVALVGNFIARGLRSNHRLQAYQVNPQAVNHVDAAVARPISEEVIKDEILEIGVVRQSGTADLGMKVRKSGRTTGFTMGEVIVVEATVTVGYGPTRRARFENQVVTSAMSSPGDSGSLLVAADSPTAVGLLFAGSDRATIHCPIGAVLSELEVAM